MFGTLQSRLPNELALYNIKTIEEANKYIAEVYVPLHNKRFGKKAAYKERAYTPWKDEGGLKDILCLEEERIVQNDNTVRYKGLVLQIPKNKARSHYMH